MKTIVTVVGIGGWYPRGVARMIEKMHERSYGIEVCSWVNALPPSAPANVIENGRDYTGYCSKPFALKHLMDTGADIGILADAAFYPIRHLQPLVDHIAKAGYYLCKNGFSIGEWASDRALSNMGLGRDQAMTMDEASSYCVGLNFNNRKSVELLEEWCRYAADRSTFPGPHTNTGAGRISDVAARSGARNPGFCSADPRCSGHRHDQTALSVLAHRYEMTGFIERPRFTAYKGASTEETVLENHGGM